MVNIKQKNQQDELQTFLCVFFPSIFSHPCLLCQTNDSMSCFSRVGCGGVLLSILVYSELTNPESEGQVSSLWTIYKHTIYKEKRGRDDMNQWRGYPLVKEHRVPGSKTTVIKEKGVWSGDWIYDNLPELPATHSHIFAAACPHCAFCLPSSSLYIRLDFLIRNT